MLDEITYYAPLLLSAGGSPMGHPITFTPGELVAFVLAICTAIITVGGATAILARWIAKAKQPETVQNERITKCERDIGELNTKFDTVFALLDHDKKRLDRLEYGNEATNEALLALLSHAINGNDVESLKAAKKKLETYLISRKE